MTELLRLQLRFAELLPRLIDEIGRRGFGCTVGEVFRPDEMVELDALRGIGSRLSVHPLRLAIDLNLFALERGPGGVIVSAKWITTTEGHRPFGAYWKALDPLCRWGGDFRSRPDGNHYSLTFGGTRA